MSRYWNEIRDFNTQRQSQRLCRTGVHLHSSLQHTPDTFIMPFPLSVQHHTITRTAPRGGLQPPLVQRLRQTYYHLLFSICFLEATHSKKQFTAHLRRTEALTHSFFTEQHEVKTDFSFADYKIVGSFFRRWRIIKMLGKQPDILLDKSKICYHSNEVVRLRSTRENLTFPLTPEIGSKYCNQKYR